MCRRRGRALGRNEKACDGLSMQEQHVLCASRAPSMPNLKPLPNDTEHEVMLAS
jgi:hypothetical protein